MISESERRRLTEIETMLRRDDPRLVRQFDEWRLAAHRRLILAILVVAAVTGVARVLGGADAAVIAAVIGLFVLAGVSLFLALLRFERGHGAA